MTTTTKIDNPFLLYLASSLIACMSHARSLQVERGFDEMLRHDHAVRSQREIPGTMMAQRHLAKIALEKVQLVRITHNLFL